MSSMLIQELLMLVLSIAALAGGTACIIRRDRRENADTREHDEKKPREVRNAGLSTQHHAA